MSLNKVYVIETVDATTFNLYTVVAIFSTKKKAQSFCKKLNRTTSTLYIWTEWAVDEEDPLGASMEKMHDQF